VDVSIGETFFFCPQVCLWCILPILYRSLAGLGAASLICRAYGMSIFVVVKYQSQSLNCVSTPSIIILSTEKQDGGDIFGDGNAKKTCEHANSQQTYDAQH